MDRIQKIFRKCRDEKRKALVIFNSCGFPDEKSSEELIGKSIEAGADIIELGVPFSDPIADGHDPESIAGCLEKRYHAEKNPRNGAAHPHEISRYRIDPVQLFQRHDELRFGGARGEAGADRCGRHSGGRCAARGKRGAQAALRETSSAPDSAGLSDNQSRPRRNDQPVSCTMSRCAA